MIVLIGRGSVWGMFDIFRDLSVVLVEVCTSLEIVSSMTVYTTHYHLSWWF